LSYGAAGGWVNPRTSLDEVEKREILPYCIDAIQPIASHYTDCTIPAPNIVIYTGQKRDKTSSLGKDKK
jgi:hypothetical protein